MNCKKCEELIAASEGSLTAQQRVRVDAHLERCAPCSQLAGSIAALVNVLGQTQPPTPPVGFAERAANFALAAEAGPSFADRFRLIGSVGALLACAALFLAVFLSPSDARVPNPSSVESEMEALFLMTDDGWHDDLVASREAD